MERAVENRNVPTEMAEGGALLPLLAELLAVKQDALRNLLQAVQVASDALQPRADKRPVSVPAQRALVTIALMSLGQAARAIEELEVVARDVKVNVMRDEP